MAKKFTFSRPPQAYDPAQEEKYRTDVERALEEISSRVASLVDVYVSIGKALKLGCRTVDADSDDLLVLDTDRFLEFDGSAGDFEFDLPDSSIDNAGRELIFTRLDAAAIAPTINLDGSAFLTLPAGQVIWVIGKADGTGWNILLQ